MLGIQYPIFAGAMAHVSDPDLVSAVSNAGGLGILATGGDTAEQVKEKVEATFSKTKQPFAVNLYLLNPNIEEVVEYLMESGVKIITTGAGTPKRYIPKFKEKGIKVIPVVPSVRIAKKMEESGADAVIVEGMEAGGHIGKSTTMTLIPQVVDALHIPVIAAGGIADSRGMAAAIMLGAEAVQIGTRFIVAKESNVHPAFKEKILNAGDTETVITGNILGHSVRLIRNQLTTDFIEKEKALLIQNSKDLSELNMVADGSLQRAVFEGDTIYGSLMAGQIAGLVRKEETSEEIILDIMEDLQSTISNKLTYFNQ